MKIKYWLTGCILICSLSAFCQYKYPFQNPELPVEERISNALSLMTLDEKVQCLTTNPTVKRLGIEGTGHVEGLHGLALGGPGKWGRDNPVPTTTFPQAIGLASSWDLSVIKKVAKIESIEARYAFQSPKYKRGGLVVRAPNADLGRDPRWGRTEECYGEDAWFNAQMTVAFIKGLQGNDPKYWRTASLMKHFLANSNEDSRDSSSSDFDARLFREYYAYPFYKGITDGGSRAFMAAYNAYNGIPMTVNPVLKEIAINEWKQNGIICTDGGAYQMLVSSHRYYPDLYKAAEGVIDAGINQFLDEFKEGVYGAIANGYLEESDLDQVLRGVFRVMIRLGMWDPADRVPYKSIGMEEDDPEPWNTAEHREAVLEVTQKTAVLLKNENDILPLNADKTASIAVMGSAAQNVFLDWYSGTPPYTVTPLEGIKRYLGDERVNAVSEDTPIEDQIAVAKKSDYVILVVGNHPYCNDRTWKKCDTPSFGKEAVDRKSLTLEEEELIKRVYAVNPNTIVVLVSSFPYAINWTQEHVPAILHMTHNSQEMGTAIANILFGDYNPGGRLVQTWPKSLDQLPTMMDYNIRNGRTYMYLKKEPLYPFGYGLSYTIFNYSGLELSQKYLPADGEVEVTLTLTNTGKRDGDEVVQLYVRHKKSSFERPLKALKGFQRVHLKAGESKQITITLKAEDLAAWDEKKGKFIVEEGMVEMMVGSSSADIRLTEEIKIRQ
ncbi:glycoside hydrolase family 3 C-terminal domain-containing protein [Fulvivirga ulvae]|uniref:glycoside hydrolase family 3 C-terminal domain-containing protein n=1 Tax=Fulvivirga ulvae TaxID=2904245 RepID=UPI001F425FAF|nr:glycoside hydrolase family 3 C-terminal domain-containing protein [Fulvivirga ulvae]UII33034.1 glycoside hydrolase family 3 C-terminal domain-containing protein [Fulvivirga ulvae]